VTVTPTGVGRSCSVRRTERRTIWIGDQQRITGPQRRHSTSVLLHRGQFVARDADDLDTNNVEIGYVGYYSIARGNSRRLHD